MTITLLAPDGVAVTAQQERQARAALNGGGFGRPLGGRSGFRVDTPADVLSATATTWTLQPCSLMLDPGATTHQGMYGWASDAVITGSMTPADATNPRKDIVYIQVNDSTAGDGSGAVSYAPQYLAGTPGATPVSPWDTVNRPPRSFLLGTISVPKATTGAPTVAANTARFVAAGARLPVASASERPPSPWVGQEVIRTDRNNHVQAWNGSAWKWVSTPERYYADPTTFSTAGSQLSKLIGEVTTAPVRSYATKARVNGRLTVVSGPIASGALQIRMAVSVGVTGVASAQAKSRMTFTNPGDYSLTSGAETNWISLAAGSSVPARIWTEQIAGAVSHAALNAATESHLWVEVLPDDD